MKLCHFQASRATALALTLALAAVPFAGCANNGEAQFASEGQTATTASVEEQATETASASEQAGETEGVISVTVNVSGEYEGTSVSENATLDVNEGATVLDALVATGLTVDVTDSAYGAYVTSIDGLAATGSNGWTYSVNGEMVSSSAQECVLEEGDTVDWEYYVA